MKKIFPTLILIFFSIKLLGQENIKHKNFSIGLISRNNSITQIDIQNQNTTRPNNPENSRDLTGSTISIVETIDNYDGTVDLFIIVDSQSPDVSYIDAVRYTFPQEITINSGYDDGGTMSESTSSAVCDITIDEATNSIVFGDASFLSDPNTGSGEVQPNDPFDD